MNKNMCSKHSFWHQRDLEIQSVKETGTDI